MNWIKLKKIADRTNPAFNFAIFDDPPDSVKTIFKLQDDEEKDSFFTSAVSLDELQDGWRDGALLVELTEEQLLDVSSWVRDTLLFVAVAVGLGVE